MMATMRQYNASQRRVRAPQGRSGSTLRMSYRTAFRIAAVVLCWMLLQGAGWAEIRVTDDAGRQLSLPAPARRIVSLAPHITELLFAVGAGAAVVGGSDFSDYPEQLDRLVEPIATTPRRPARCRAWAVGADWISRLFWRCSPTW